jgi:phosphoribosylanthranilate isomerase
MSLFIKICGITELEAARAAVTSGADAVGFVFADSSRRVTPRHAVSISGELPASVLRVAVFRHPDPAEIEAVLEEFTPDLVQADHNTLEGFDAVATLPVFREDDDEAPAGGPFLYEGPVSGSGQLVDRGLATSVARLGDMVLAGGLRPDNVGRAIATVRPFGVDVSSGVESSPGVKDPAQIRSFVAAVRAAEERLVNA